MIAYRLVHERALAQTGGRPLVTQGATGRWNSQGVRVTYLAEHPALAALEMLNYVAPFRSLRGYRLYTVTLDEADIEDAPASVNVLDYAQTRPYGDAWVHSGRTLALRVPSAAAPRSRNVLLNQRHPAFDRLVPDDLGTFLFDQRLAALVEQAPRKT